MFKVTCSIKTLLLVELPSEMTGIAGVSVRSEAVEGTLKSSTEVCGIPGLLKCVWENLREGGDVFSWASEMLFILDPSCHQSDEAPSLSFCISPLKRRLSEGPNRTNRGPKVDVGQVSWDPLGQHEPLQTGSRSWWFQRLYFNN